MPTRRIVAVAMFLSCAGHGRPSTMLGAGSRRRAPKATRTAASACSSGEGLAADRGGRHSRGSRVVIFASPNEISRPLQTGADAASTLDRSRERNWAQGDPYGNVPRSGRLRVFDIDVPAVVHIKIGLIAVMFFRPGRFCAGILHLSQFGSQFAGPQSQTHAFGGKPLVRGAAQRTNGAAQEDRHRVEGRTVNLHASGNGFLRLWDNGSSPRPFASPSPHQSGAAKSRNFRTNSDTCDSINIINIR